LTTETPRRRSGFTLIEVIGALLIFSAGVIMLLQITSSLSRSIEHSAVRSMITAEGQERVDSLNALAYSSLAVGTTNTTLTFRGISYTRTQAITQYSPLVKRVIVSLTPTAGTGPSFSATLYRTDAW
jgi:Tfp pilus assembly protein PilV